MPSTSVQPDTGKRLIPRTDWPSSGSGLRSRYLQACWHSCVRPQTIVDSAFFVFCRTGTRLAPTISQATDVRSGIPQISTVCGPCSRQPWPTNTMKGDGTIFLGDPNKASTGAFLSLGKLEAVALSAAAPVAVI